MAEWVWIFCYTGFINIREEISTHRFLCVSFGQGHTLNTHTKSREKQIRRIAKLTIYSEYFFYFLYQVLSFIQIIFRWNHY
jgi:hypothetical protein